jgi:hypothetical protein
MSPEKKFRAPFDWVGPTPWEEIKEAFEELLGDRLYTMELVDPAEVQVAREAWNQGIDARLEYITPPSRVKWKDMHRVRLRMELDLSGLLVFLRRLYEMEESDPAEMLREAILSSLGIEEEA